MRWLPSVSYEAYSGAFRGYSAALSGVKKWPMIFFG